MLQTRASLADDMAACSRHVTAHGDALLYAEVESLDVALVKRLRSALVRGR